MTAEVGKDRQITRGKYGDEIQKQASWKKIRHNLEALNWNPLSYRGPATVCSQDLRWHEAEAQPGSSP